MDRIFKALTFEDAAVIRPFFGLRPNNTCDSECVDTFIWKKYYAIEYCVVDGRAIEWKSVRDGRVQTSLPLCRAEDLRHYFYDTKEYFNNVLGLKLFIELADEAAVRLLDLDPALFKVTECTDAADYLYSGDALRTLSGKKYHKKKNHINAFMKEYEGRYEYRTLHTQDSPMICGFLDSWLEQKGGAEELLDHETEGVRDVVSCCEALGARMGGIFIDGRLKAFSMGSYNSAMDMAVIHAEKADASVNGLYSFINQQFLIHEFPTAATVNREDDVGLEGLRQAKLSYHPIGYARKFNIEEL